MKSNESRYLSDSLEQALGQSRSRPSDLMMPQKRRVWPLWIALAGTFLVYLPILQAPYYFDDLQAFGGDLNDVEPPSLSALLSPQQRPLLQSLFALLSSATHSPRMVYRLFGLAIHLFNGWLIWNLVTVVLSRLSPSVGDNGDSARIQLRLSWIAWWVTCFWLVHPMNVQTVGSIVQQAESLMTSCLLGYLILIASIRPDRLWGTAILTYVILLVGLYLKVVMVIAVPAGILFDALLSKCSIAKVIKQHWLVHVPPLVACLGLAVVLTPMLLRAEGGVGFGGDAAPVGTYLMTSARAFLQYVGTALWPVDLAIDRSPHWIVSPWKAAPWIFAVMGYCLIACQQWRTPVPDQRRRLLGLLLLMPLVILLPTSTVVPTADPFFEHRFYFALAFVIGAVVWVAYWVFERFFSLRNAVLWLGVAVLVVLMVRTHLQTKQYRSLESIWLTALEVDPDNARAAQNWLAAMQEANRDHDVILELNRIVNIATEARKDHTAVTHQLAKAHLREGNLQVAGGILVGLSKKFPAHKSLLTDRERREYGERAFDLSIALFQQNALPQAMQAIEYALKCTPDDPFALAVAGEISLEMNRPADAQRFWKKAMMRNPNLLPELPAKIKAIESNGD